MKQPISAPPEHQESMACPPHCCIIFHSTRLLLATALLTLAACVGKGPRELAEDAVPVPGKWQHGSSTIRPLDTAALPTWWRRFHDPVLDALITDALRSSTTVRSALEKITEYRARRNVEAANLFPTLTANQSGAGTRTDSRITGTTFNSESYKASFNTSWQVDLFGKQYQNLKAAGADLEKISENYYGAQVTLASDVATAYVALRSAEGQLAVVENSLITRRETVQLTQWLEQAGTGDALDTQRSLTTLEQARTTMPALRLSIEQARNQLAFLSGRTPGSLDAQLARPRSVPEMPAGMATGIPADTLRQRPDVRAAERALEAAFFRTQNARRQRLPSLTLTGSIGMEALKQGHIFSPESMLASIVAGFATPVIDAGRLRQNVRILTSQQRQALIAYESTVLNAFTEVENALAAVQRYNEQLHILNHALSAAREAAKLSALQYSAGQVDLLVSLDAQRTLLTFEQQQVTTTAQCANASIQLYKALGGGWTHL
ncbi:efflux transporter outer membrane subunit [Prosthecobacter sp.]|jgi:multidrug efflux system outer membrane protein|uniref:efflux transporter outer membrane subunit n=1 Tax=Prosthecobacter sp. TaxID=1965333 RepID=UPI0037C9B502